MTWVLLMSLLLAAPAVAADPPDPRQWLEDVTGEKPLTWVKARNAESTGELAAGPEFTAMRDRILRVYDSKEKIPFVSKSGDRWYNFWQDATHVKGIWRRTTLDEYRKPEPAWETALDLDELAAEEKENWVWHGAQLLYPTYDRALVSLSRGGADADVVREFDLVKKAFVPDGFKLPEAKSSVSWRTRDSVFVGTDFGPGSMTKSGYPRVVKEWTRGTPLAAAVTVREGQDTDVSVSAYRVQEAGYERDIVHRGKTFYTGETFLRDGPKLTKLDVPDDLKDGVNRDDYFAEPRADWTAGGRTYKAGSLLTIKLAKLLAGDRDFTVLFEPTARRSLAGYSLFKSGLLLSVLDNVSTKVYLLADDGGKWGEPTELPVPPLSSLGMGPVEPHRKSDLYRLSVTNYLTPGDFALGTLGGPPAEVLKRGPRFFDAAGMAVSQHEATSKDGTKVPYFQVSPKGFNADGTAATLLYGYGGFEVSLTPGYSAVAGSEWVARGGVYVVANIRGGGEFGPGWHQAALKAKRGRAYEDFAAVADDLVSRKVTSVSHLGAMGGSNGGLLMGNMLTQYPGKFGAIVCSVPLLDMKRYHKLLAGASWMAEYGDPDQPGEWNFIRTFSPYHLATPGVKYPRTLFTTSTRDDRVHPGHARKMVALLKEQGHDCLLYENTEGGHGGAADNKQRAYLTALEYTFLWKQLR